MNTKFIASLAATLVLGTSSLAMAQTTTTPRVDQVEKRIDNQQERIDNGVQNGTMTTKEATRDEKRDVKVEKQLSKDEAKHNGHITKKEQAHLNKKLDKNSEKIHEQKTDGK